MRLHSNSAFRQNLDRLAEFATQHTRGDGVSARIERERQRRLSPDEVAQIIADYKAGASIKGLAAKYALHRATVGAQLTRHAVPRRPKGLKREQVHEAARLYEQGWSLARLGEHFGVSSSTVRQRLAQEDVALRSRRGW